MPMSEERLREIEAAWNAIDSSGAAVDFVHSHAESVDELIAEVRRLRGIFQNGSIYDLMKEGENHGT